MSSDRSSFNSNDLKEFTDIVKDKFTSNNSSSIKETLKNKYSEYKTIKSTNDALKKNSLRFETYGFAALVAFLLYKGPITRKMTLGYKSALLIPAALFIPGHFILQSYINNSYRNKLMNLVTGDQTASTVKDKVVEKAKDTVNEKAKDYVKH